MSTKTTPCPDEPDEFSIARVATKLDVDDSTVRRYVAKGWLPARRVGPKLIRISASDLEKFRNSWGSVA